MARKDDLRKNRLDTVINNTSKRQEKSLMRAVKRVKCEIEQTYNVQLYWEKEWMLKDVIQRLSLLFPSVDFADVMCRSCMRPDGGILSVLNKKEEPFPILISEKKNQGTNDLRALEGKIKQAKGNAIERLGKNVIGFRTALLAESIFPFVCFGDGCDFSDDSSIIDRVVTIAEFGKLNEVYLHNSEDGSFNRGTFYFRAKEWSEEEMFERLLDIADRALLYYFSKYHRNSFLKLED